MRLRKYTKLSRAWAYKTRSKWNKKGGSIVVDGTEGEIGHVILWGMQHGS
jgi:hypothetical protein